MRFPFSAAARLTVATFVLYSVGCGKAPVVVAPEAPKVTVMHPEQRELSDHEEFNGWMAADDKVEVRSRVKGHIKKIDFTDGQYVKKGDLLFELDPRPFEAEIGKARDSLKVM
jgi:multidrug efflux pump subunit AcrA (membrane-fusion protein)